MSNKETEEWRKIDGYDGKYEISNMGRVKSLKGKTKLLKLFRDNNGYHKVVLSKNNKLRCHFVHRLVALAFVPNEQNKPVVDHIDTNPCNNNADNLRWVTQKENCLNPITRENNSKSKKGHPYYGKPFTEETKEKLRAAMLGRKASPETREKLRISHLGLCRPNVNKGKHWVLENGKRVYY